MWAKFHQLIAQQINLVYSAEQKGRPLGSQALFATLACVPPGVRVRPLDSPQLWTQVTTGLPRLQKSSQREEGEEEEVQPINIRP